MKSTRTGHRWAAMLVAAILMTLAAAIAAPAQTFTTLDSFDNTDGAKPLAGLVQATDGNLYGTTNLGGANNSGAVFKITPSGTLTKLYSFCSQAGCADGAYPTAALVQATDGNLYGTTVNGGATYGGAIFRIIPGGTPAVDYSFCLQGGCTDGEHPYAALVQATDGNFYGTTRDGGDNGGGTIFMITPGGTLTTLYSFCSEISCTDGAYPEFPLVQATNGNFYGTTNGGGANGGGTVFKITPSGTVTLLYSFCSHSGCTDGNFPEAGLIQATNGNLYGTTAFGGNGGSFGSGTIFKITPSGTLTTIYSFCSQSGCADGTTPAAALVQATDGNLYGTTASGGGGSFGSGTIFKITPSGTLTTIYSFCSQSGCADGTTPAAALVQATDGDFFGTTYNGGASGSCSSGCGTVFSLSVGLGPFVETQPNYGKVGAAVKILGTNLTGATSVTFNGTPSFFKVKSSSEIGTVVPVGATSGRVQVVTPSGTLTSNVNFRVEP